MHEWPAALSRDHLERMSGNVGANCLDGYMCKGTVGGQDTRTEAERLKGPNLQGPLDHRMLDPSCHGKQDDAGMLGSACCYQATTHRQQQKPIVGYTVGVYATSSVFKPNDAN